MTARQVILIILSALFSLPFLYLPLLSVAKGWVFPEAFPNAFTLRHWSAVPGLYRPLGLGLLLSTFVALSATALGFVVSRSIALHPAKNQLLRLAFFPYAFSPVVYAFCLQYFFNKSQLIGTFGGVWLAQLFITFPFCVLVLTPWWSRRVFDTEQLTYTLGGSTSDAWLRVLLPMARPVLLLCLFQGFLISWFEYGLTSVLGLGRVKTMTISVFQYIGEADVYVAAVSSCLLIGPPLLILWLNKKAVSRLDTA